MTDNGTDPASQQPERAPTRPYAIWLAAAGMAIAGVVALLPRNSPTMASLEMTPSRANAGMAESCLGKNRCVLVYIAPWCPACKSSLQAMTELRDQWKGDNSHGLNIIIGADRPEKLEEMAAAIGASTFVDPDGSLHDKLGVNGVPYWVVYDDENHVIKRFAGGMSSPDAIRHFLDLGT